VYILLNIVFLIVEMFSLVQEKTHMRLLLILQATTQEYYLRFFSSRLGGVPSVGCNYTVLVGKPPSGPPYPGIETFAFKYVVANGEKVLYFQPAMNAPIAINASAYGIWVYGDGNSNILSCIIIDSTQQTFSYTFYQSAWGGLVGWKYIVIDFASSFNAGAKDGIIHYPIYWNSYFSWQSMVANNGTIYFSTPIAIA